MRAPPWIKVCPCQLSRPRSYSLLERGGFSCGSLIPTGISHHDTAQQSSQKIGPSYYAFLLAPDQDEIIVDDIVLGVFRLHPHATDHATQRGAHIGYDDWAVPVDFGRTGTV